MQDYSRLIKILEVYSDIAGSKRGASLGIKALKKSCSDLNSDYFKKYLVQRVDDTHKSYFNKSKYPNAKYIKRVSKVIEKTAKKIKKLRQNNIFPIVLAGDHSSCAGTILGLKAAHKDDEIGVVYIDAHADIHSPYTSESGNMHGMPLAIATALDNKENAINEISKEEKKYWNNLKYLVSKDAAIKPENIVFCALRDFEKAEEELIKKHKIQVYSAQEITYIGIKNTVEQILKKLNHCKHIYISFDVDSIDPVYIPGTGTPSSGGLSFEQALQLNKELIKSQKVCCWEIAEINPLYNKNSDDSKKLFLMLEEVTKTLVKFY